jgi:hypothetical protein
MTTLLALLLLAPQDAARGIAAWDTAQPGQADRKSWTALAQGATSVKGDLVLTNGRLTATLRKDAAVLDLSGTGPARARIGLAGAVKVSSISLSELGRGGLCLDAAYKTASGTEAAAKFRLKRGDNFVAVEPGKGAAKLRIEASSRFAVLPDFFADDIVVDATRIAQPSAPLPSENFILHLTGAGDSMVMGVFEHREQDVQVALAGEGAARKIAASEIEFGKDAKKVWVAVFEGAGIWHERDVAAADLGKVVPLDWTMPFPAQWRVDFGRTDELTSSWDLLLQEKEGAGYVKPTWAAGGLEKIGADRKRWMGSAMYTIVYPAWSDAAGRGFVQPMKHRMLTHGGPTLVYPLNRVPSTPPDVFTVVDVVRNTMGQGPCEYILALESQKAERKGRATCSVRDELKGIYESGRQKQSRKEIEGYLQQGVDFVKHIRGRVEQYLEFARKLRDYLAEEKKKDPSIVEALAPLEKVLREVDSNLEDRKDKIKTPEHVVRLTEEFRKTLLEYEGADAAAKVKVYTDELTDIGGNQDDLVARLRWVVKTLRQRAGMLMTTNPKLAPLAEEVRRRAAEALRNPAIHEENRP